MGAVLNLAGLHPVHQGPQLRRGGVHPGLDSGLAGHGLQETVPGGIGVGPAQAQVLGQLLQGGGGVLRANVRGNFTHQQGACAEILTGEAELLQKGEAGQGGIVGIRLQVHRQGLQQELAHRRLPALLQGVEAQALVGGVLVDEPEIFAFILANYIGIQGLAYQAPGGGMVGEGLLEGQVDGIAPGGGGLRDGGLRDGGLGGDRLFRCREGGRGGGHRCGPGLFPGLRGCRGRRGHAVSQGELCVRMHRRGRAVAAQGALFCRGRGLALLVLLDGHRSVKGLLDGLGGRIFPGGEQVLHGVVYRVKDSPLILKFHHGLSRVDIHIHGALGQGDVQDAAGELALEQPVAVGLLQGGGEELAAHKAAIDEKELAGPGAAAV